jgi:hypothetical protein
MNRITLTCLSGALAVLGLADATWALSIPIPNGDFETYDVPGVLNPATGSNWASEPGADGIVGDLDVNDEFWTATSNNARWGMGWSTNVNQGGAGLNHPDWGKFRHGNVDYSGGEGAGVDAGDPNLLDNLFSGYFIGHMNIADSQGAAIKYTQSGTLRQLAAGRYVGSIAVGFTRAQNRPDVKYTLELVTGHTVDPGFGSLDGTPLPGNSLSMETDNDGDTYATNEQLLSFVLNIAPGDPLIGQDFAIRITAENTGMRNGIVDGFTTNSFSQATFDNVRLEASIPEPTSLTLAVTTAFAFSGCLHRRRTR